MLVLTRKPGESIIVGGDITVTVARVSGNRVKILVDAPKECSVKRSELVVEPEMFRCSGRAPTQLLAR